MGLRSVVLLLGLVLTIVVASASALSVFADPHTHRAPSSSSASSSSLHAEGVLLDEEAMQRLAFKDFVYKFGKKYSNDAEVEKRFAIFKDNLKTIDELNSRGSHATFGVTKFADLTRDEFKSAYLSPMGYPTTHSANAPVAPLLPKEVVSSIPSSWDWRTHGAVTPVKNQGACGSCWAFSTTGNVEGQWFLAGHPLTGLSEQNLVDCDHKCRIYENQKSCDAGCGGGLQPNAYTYIIDNGGIDTEASYPYEGYDDNCRYSAANRGAQITNWTMISQDEDQMAAQLVQRGPLAIAASAVEWQFYLFGVFDYPCGTELDHGILIVGYGEEVDDFGFNIKYWIVKNSWGQDWGVESGYILLQRGVGECGLNLYVSTSIINH